MKAQVDSKNEEIDRIKVQHGSASHELAGSAMLVYESYFPRQKIVLHGPKRVQTCHIMPHLGLWEPGFADALGKAEAAANADRMSKWEEEVPRPLL